LYLSNYLSDKSWLWNEDGTAKRWEDLVDVSRLPKPLPKMDNYTDACYGAVYQNYVEKTNDKFLRQTTFEISGLTGADAPKVEMTGHEGFKHQETFDAPTKTLKVVVDHNGIVRIKITTK